MRKLIILLCVIVAFAPTYLFAQADSSIRKGELPNVNSYWLSRFEEIGFKSAANSVFELAEARVVEATIGLDEEQITLNWTKRGKRKKLQYNLVANNVKVEIIRRKSKLTSITYTGKDPESEDRQPTRKIEFAPGKPFQITGFLNPEAAMEALSEALDNAKSILEDVVQPPKKKKDM